MSFSQQPTEEPVASTTSARATSSDREEEMADEGHEVREEEQEQQEQEALGSPEGSRVRLSAANKEDSDLVQTEDTEGKVSYEAAEEDEQEMLDLDEEGERERSGEVYPQVAPGHLSTCPPPPERESSTDTCTPAPLSLEDPGIVLCYAADELVHDAVGEHGSPVARGPTPAVPAVSPLTSLGLYLPNDSVHPAERRRKLRGGEGLRGWDVVLPHGVPSGEPGPVVLQLTRVFITNQTQTVVDTQECDQRQSWVMGYSAGPVRCLGLVCGENPCQLQHNTMMD